MIENFFQNLKLHHVDYLMISGQAAVLYGAAVFSEDIDLWIRPTGDNADALLDSLTSVNAAYYKLTPPLKTRYMLRGHGFHFRVPANPDFYLDVMGQPPRVPVFDEAISAATVMSTAWGEIPTIGIEHLAALKTTQRLGDYPVISQLVLRRMETIKRPCAEDYRWALDNLYTFDELDDFLRRFPEAAAVCDANAPVLQTFAAEVRNSSEPNDDTRMQVERWLSDRILERRQADRDHWREIISELRDLRSAGKLMPSGSPVIRTA